MPAKGRDEPVDDRLREQVFLFPNPTLVKAFLGLLVLSQANPEGFA
jgi:hypothetical protein